MDYTGKGSGEMEMGVPVLPHFKRDTTDRNRTSPFAFTGNKFEFRMLGSTLSVSGPNVVLNTIVSEELDQFADRLENATDLSAAVLDIIRETLRDHGRIIFNGDGYAEAWQEEAARRGLLNLKSTPEALPHFVAPKNIALFTRHKIFTETEMHSRCEILLENYCKTLNIEALTMLDMARKDIYPAVSSYVKDLADTALAKKSLSAAISTQLEETLIRKLSALSSSFYDKTEALEAAVGAAGDCGDTLTQAHFYHDKVFAAMQEMRAVADEIETLVGEKYWPYPTYGRLLFGV